MAPASRKAATKPSPAARAAGAAQEGVRARCSPSLPFATIALSSSASPGLAALGVALFGTRRFNDEILKPVSAATFLPLAAAAAPQADRVWAETRPWRDYVARVLSSINTAEVREHVADRLTQWLDRFK